jgi:hypothetical protein
MKGGLYMSVKEIPQNQWKEFFRDFTRFHQGWIASVDIFSRDMGAQKEANEMVFAGLVAGTRHDSRITIEVMLGETAGSHIRHTIALPTHVRYESQGESEVLQIEDESDMTVLISCHRSAVPAKVSYAALQGR